jgi:hypothetical protein
MRACSGHCTGPVIFPGKESGKRARLQSAAYVVALAIMLASGPTAPRTEAGDAAPRHCVEGVMFSQTLHAARTSLLCLFSGAAIWNLAVSFRKTRFHAFVKQSGCYEAQKSYSLR